MGRVQLRETLRVPQGTVLDIDTLELGLVHLKDTDRCKPEGIPRGEAGTVESIR